MAQMRQRMQQDEELFAKERLEEAEARRIESHAASDQGQGQLRRFQDHWQGMQQAMAGEVVSSKSPSSSPTSSVGVVNSSSNKQVGSGGAGSAADGGQKGAGPSDLAEGFLLKAEHEMKKALRGQK